MRVNRAVLAGFYPPPFAGEPIHVKQLAQLLRDHGLMVEILNLNRGAHPSSGHNRRSWLLILVASLAGRLRGAPTVLTLHSGLLPAYVAGFGRIVQGVATWTLGSFARSVCVNGEIRRHRAPGSNRRPHRRHPCLPRVPDREIIRDFRPVMVAVACGEERIPSTGWRSCFVRSSSSSRSSRIWEWS